MLYIKKENDQGCAFRHARICVYQYKSDSDTLKFKPVLMQAFSRGSVSSSSSLSSSSSSLSLFSSVFYFNEKQLENKCMFTFATSDKCSQDFNKTNKTK